MRSPDVLASLPSSLYGVRRLRTPIALAAAAVALCGVPVSGASAAPQPILAGPWGMGQEGYGHVAPRTIFNGGDPTGLVKDIEWLTWGGPRAVGVGLGFYAGPNQITAEATQQAAVIVLFQLGSCHGRRAYDAAEWYFPGHGEHFRPHTYIHACAAR